MKRKILALTLTVLMFVGAVPLAAMAETSVPVVSAPVEAAEEPVVVTKLAVSSAVCDLCGKTVDAVTKFACGEHSACADCAKNEYYMLKHNEKLPCGKYECDGVDHYRLPNDYCPDTENPHYHCEDPDATHTCPTCGVTYNCALSANQHAKCAECGKAWCKGQHGFCTMCGEWRCIAGGSHAPCSAKGCGLYDCQTHYHCAKCGAVELVQGKHVWVCGHYYCALPAGSHDPCRICGGYLCDGKTHGECGVCGKCLSDGHKCEIAAFSLKQAEEEPTTGGSTTTGGGSEGSNTTGSGSEGSNTTGGGSEGGSTTGGDPTIEGGGES